MCAAKAPALVGFHSRSEVIASFIEKINGVVLPWPWLNLPYSQSMVEWHIENGYYCHVNHQIEKRLGIEGCSRSCIWKQECFRSALLLMEDHMRLAQANAEILFLVRAQQARSPAYLRVIGT
jgi:hypothetical protein